MGYRNLIKKINLPINFTVPTQLIFDDITARPLGRKDLADDLAGVNSSIETIQQTRGESWPTERLDKDFDLLDLAWHEREFRDGDSFAYVVYNTNGEYIGCFYLYGIGVRAELTEELLDYDVDASWWVTSAAYNSGYYEKLYDALRQWLSVDFPFTKVYYSNQQIPSE
jgi:hypothetical protein